MSKYLEQKQETEKQEKPRDCGCGFGQSCTLHQKYHEAPPEFDDRYESAPKRFTIDEIRRMKKDAQ